MTAERDSKNRPIPAHPKRVVEDKPVQFIEAKLPSSKFSSLLGYFPTVWRKFFSPKGDPGLDEITKRLRGK